MMTSANDQISICTSGRDKNGKYRFGSKIVISVLVFIALFTVAMTIIYCLTGGVPEALCAGVYSMASAELIGLAGKRIFDNKKKGGE